jgi:hypothetical protein
MDRVERQEAKSLKNDIRIPKKTKAKVYYFWFKKTYSRIFLKKEKTSTTP